ncbi:MAG TPA: potassium-transporting ATPase subunit KdpC [Terriglobales bacterium]|nr:potassium-transporting ATPase subunit KdpC [Terriglobales bacterium]
MLASLPSELLQALRLTVVVFVVTGLIYPFVGTGLAQALFNHQANGSLITKNGQVVGSSLIGQQFTSDKYFHGRPSATVSPSTGKPEPYAADNSAGSNLGPSNQALVDRVKTGVQTVRQQDGLSADQQVPADLVTTDFSGFDPNITEASALLQVNRVAQARSLDPAKVHDLVEGHVQGRILWVFGEPHVNVLDLNMALDSGAAA